MKTSISLAMLFLCIHLFGQSGFLDSNFATNGSMIMDNSIGGTTEVVRTVKILPGGKYIAGGYTGPYYANKYFLTVIDTAGNRPTSFNSGSWKIFMTGSNYVNEVIGIIPTTDGKFVILGKTGTSSSTAETRAIVMRLNSDGSVDGSFTTQTFGNSSVYEIPKDIIYNNWDQSIYILTNYSIPGPSPTSYTTRVRKLLASGNVDPTYASANSGVYSNPNIEGNKMTSLANGAIVVAGSALSGGYFDFAALKIKTDGTDDANFGISGLRKIPIVANQNDVPKAIGIDGNGNIVLGGNAVVSTSPSTQIDAAFVCLNSTTGTLETSFSNDGIVTYDIQNVLGESAATNEYIETITVGLNGKIIAGGSATTVINRGLVLQLNLDGSLDTDYANGGVFVMSSPQSYYFTSAFSSALGKLIMGGHADSGASNLLVSQFNISKPTAFNIIGKSIVSIESQVSYKISPQLDGYSYQWSYDSDSVYILGRTDREVFTIYFPEMAPSANLYCNVYNSANELVARDTVEVSVKAYRTLAEQLRPVNCTYDQSDCSDIFINSVSLVNGYTLSSNTGCDESGYSDYTASEFYDTLTIGDRFSISLTSPAQKRKYAAAWIDLNNDGAINEQFEFCGTAESDENDSTIVIYNAAVHPKAPEGPVRMRVRVRASGPYSVSEGCPAESDDGETEDYLILLAKGENTLAPNFITPNNDGKNDFFVVRGIDQEAESNELKIFDRLGNLVFEMKNYDNTWQGVDKNNERVSSGTYYYLFTQNYDDKKASFEDVTRGFLEIRY